MQIRRRQQKSALHIFDRAAFRVLYSRWPHYVSPASRTGAGLAWTLGQALTSTDGTTRCDIGYLASVRLLLASCLLAVAVLPLPRRLRAQTFVRRRCRRPSSRFRLPPMRCRPPIQQLARKGPLAGDHRPLGRRPELLRRSPPRISARSRAAGPLRRRPAALQPRAALRRPQLPRFAPHAAAAASARPVRRLARPRSNTHYYTTPPWQDLVRRGARAMDIALADENFLQSHGIRARGQQVDTAAGRNRCSSPAAMRSAARDDASAVAAQIARLANQRIGLSETATLLEFTAAAAGGLDHYSAFLTADQLRDIYSQIEGNFVGPGRRAQGRQRRAVDRARDSAQPGREGRHPRRRSHRGGRRPGDRRRCRPTKPPRCSPAPKAAWCA